MKFDSHPQQGHQIQVGRLKVAFSTNSSLYLKNSTSRFIISVTYQ